MTRVRHVLHPLGVSARIGGKCKGSARVGLGRQETSDDVVRGQEQKPGQGQGVRVHGSLFIQVPALGQLQSSSVNLTGTTLSITRNWDIDLFDLTVPTFAPARTTA